MSVRNQISLIPQTPSEVPHPEPLTSWAVFGLSSIRRIDCAVGMRGGVPQYALGQSYVTGSLLDINDRSAYSKDVRKMSLSMIVTYHTHASLAGLSLFAVRESALDRLRRIVSRPLTCVTRTPCISTYQSARHKTHDPNFFAFSSVAAMDHTPIPCRESADYAIALVALLSCFNCNSRRHTRGTLLPPWRLSYVDMQCGSFPFCGLIFTFI